MRILKGLFIGLLILVAIPLVAALFVKKEYGVVREIEINKPKQEVFDYIKMLKNQDQYSVWATMDPAMKKSYKGTDGTVGFVSAWDSQNKEVGTGEQEITKIVEGERLDMELRFIRPMEATDKAFMITEAVTDSTTKVKWGFDGTMKYPMNLMLLFMDFDKMLGGMLDTGLKNMKGKLEQ